MKNMVAFLMAVLVVVSLSGCPKSAVNAPSIWVEPGDGNAAMLYLELPAGESLVDHLEVNVGEIKSVGFNNLEFNPVRPTEVESDGVSAALAVEFSEEGWLSGRLYAVGENGRVSWVNLSGFESWYGVNNSIITPEGIVEVFRDSYMGDVPASDPTDPEGESEVEGEEAIPTEGEPETEGEVAEGEPETEGEATVEGEETEGEVAPTSRMWMEFAASTNAIRVYAENITTTGFDMTISGLSPEQIWSVNPSLEGGITSYSIQSNGDIYIAFASAEAVTLNGRILSITIEGSAEENVFGEATVYGSDPYAAPAFYDF